MTIKVDQTATQNPTPPSQGASSTTSATKSKPLPPPVSKDLEDYYRWLGAGQANLERVTQKYWSDSPEFARAFLLSARDVVLRFVAFSENDKSKVKIKWPVLITRMKRAILNLIPKNTDPPQDLKHLDESHHIVGITLRAFRMAVPTLHLENDPKQVRFIRDLIKERPRYKEFFCKLSESSLKKKPDEACW